MRRTRLQDPVTVADNLRQEAAECRRLAELEAVFSKRLRLERLARSHERKAETIALRMNIEPTLQRRMSRRRKAAG